jgi:hypothetical protein
LLLAAFFLLLAACCLLLAAFFLLLALASLFDARSSGHLKSLGQWASRKTPAVGIGA